MTSQFLTCLDGLDKHEGRVIVISTNEDIGDIDPALKRPGRFENTVRFEYPDLGLIRQFCEEREIKIDFNKFGGWSFARIDMFISRYKVAKFMQNTSIDAFYEKFIHDMGVTDETVEAYANI